MSRKRRKTEIFSISFLDCICCGFGGVLLLFVLVAGKQQNAQERKLAEIKAVVGQFEFDVKSREDRIETTDAQAIVDQGRKKDIESKNVVRKSEVSQLEQDLARMLQSEAELRKENLELLAQKEALSTAEKPDPVPIPNVKRRQYLTGFKLEGQYVLFLVRASGSMVSDDIDEAVAMQSESDDVKRQSKKWQRVVLSVQWLISSLPGDAAFQVMLFAEDTEYLLDQYSVDWIDRNDGEGIQEVIDALAEVVPSGGANLERAFGVIRSMPTVPSSLVLLTDGLPTQSDTYASGEFVTDIDRVRFFNAAAQIAAPDIPINTILYPLIGDPASPFLFWQLADRTNGALVSPAPSWPDT
jgi:hypothetical protein